MMHLRTATEIEAIEAAGAVLAQVFETIEEKVVPGVSTAELDQFAEELIRSNPGATPAFKGLYGFPATLCTSINDEVVHGIPSKRRVLDEGDIVSIDAGVQLDGWFADRAMTYPVGRVSGETSRLLDTTRAALAAGIACAVIGNRMGDIGAAVQKVAEDAGMTVVRELVGHGIGREPHEEPQVPNFGRKGTGLRLLAGLVIAIEPMVNRGVAEVRTLPDRWTVVTTDGERSAHFEHTVAVMASGPRILTGSSRIPGGRGVG